MKPFLATTAAIALLALAACEPAPAPDAGAGAAGGTGAPATGGTAGGTAGGTGTPAPGSLEEQLAGLEPAEQRAYVAALTVRDGCLRNRTDLNGAVTAMVNAGFTPATITNVPDMKAANSGTLRIYTDTNPARGNRSLCAVDLPVESFEMFVSMLDAMITQNFPGAERGSSGDKPAWKLPGAPETFIVADAAIDGGDGGAARMGAITFVTR